MDINDISRCDIEEQLRVLKGPIQWSLYLTNKCMLRCKHCFNRSGIVRREELNDEEVMNTVLQIAAITPWGLCFCGGEPLLREKMLLRCTKILSDAGVRVNLVSNGYIMSDRTARNLRRAGIYFVQISLDGLKPRTHDRLRNKPGAHAKAVIAIKSLVDAGVNVGIAFTPTKYNVDELEQLCYFAAQIGVRDFRVQPIMPLGTLARFYNDILPTEFQYREIVKLIEKINYEKKIPSMRILWGDPVDHLIRFPLQYPKPLFVGEISADGYLAISSYLPLYFGNVRRHSIEKYWKAGFSRAWDMKISKAMASQVRCINDFAKMKPLTFWDKPILIDLVEDNVEMIDALTEKYIETLSRENING